MFESLRLRRRAGQPYDGPATYVDGNGQGDPRHGFYALTDDGKALRRPLVRLVAVAYPDGSHSYEIARKDDPPHRREGPLVPLEFAGQGQSGLETGGGHGAQSADWNAGVTIPQTAVFDGNAKTSADKELVWGDLTVARSVLNGDTASFAASAWSWTEE